MIKIIMKNGTVYENDPQYGYNLDRVSDILDCLRIAGKYCLATKVIPNINIYADEVQDVIEE
jgi:hypothetical protein